MDGTTRYFDLTNPEAPRETYAKQTGKQVNMISQSWDGKRVYITCSLLAKWDKKGADDEQFLRAFDWDGKELKQAFEVDFKAQKLGRPHHMKFTARPADRARLPPDARCAHSPRPRAGLRGRARARGGGCRPAAGAAHRFRAAARGHLRAAAHPACPDGALLDSSAQRVSLAGSYDRQDHAAHVLLYVLRGSVGLPVRVPDARAVA